MTEGVNIDWGLLGQPKDYVGDYTNAFQVGRQLAGQKIQQNAFSQVSPRNGLASSVSAPTADPIATLTPAQRAAAADRADILANFAVGLKSRPHDERAAVLAHLTPALAAQGFSPDVVRAFDASDENLDAVAASARAVGGQLAAGEAQGGQPAEKGDGDEHAEQPGGDGLNVGDAEIAR